MADLSKIKVGDKLKLTATVAVLFPDYPSYPVSVIVGNEQNLLRPVDIEAAEHIPAPRVFKRGDWVKLHSSDPLPTRQKGIVLQTEQRTIVSFGSRLEVEVNWPDGQTHWYVPNDLEPDEAPE